MPKTKEYAVDVWYMEYRAGTSDKFYQVFVSETGLCVLRWGRRGSTGQHSQTQYRTYADALDNGKKQLYAKKSKGYTQQGPDAKFMAGEDVILRARSGDPSYLVSAWSEAQRKGLFEGAKQTVLKHYSDFADQVQGLLHRAEHADLDTVMAEFESVESIWQEIDDKHAEISAALTLAKQTLFQKMMAGGLK